VFVDVEVELVEGAEIPTPKDGDCFIDIRLKANTPTGRPIDVAELEFWRIDFNLV
jgi:hypothetical protein